MWITFNQHSLPGAVVSLPAAGYPQCISYGVEPTLKMAEPLHAGFNILHVSWLTPLHYVWGGSLLNCVCEVVACVWNVDRCVCVCVCLCVCAYDLFVRVVSQFLILAISCSVCVFVCEWNVCVCVCVCVILLSVCVCVWLFCVCCLSAPNPSLQPCLSLTSPSSAQTRSDPELMLLIRSWCYWLYRRDSISHVFGNAINWGRKTRLKKSSNAENKVS